MTATVVGPSADGVTAAGQCPDDAPLVDLAPSVQERTVQMHAPRALALRALLAIATIFALVQGRPAPAVAAPVMPTYLVPDMVTFDRAYIAALALTSQEKLEPSRTAMAILVPTWQAFNAKYSGANPSDPQWRPDFDAVSGMMERADDIVRDGHRLPEAHGELEEVRITLMHLRERNGLPYFVDLLTRYHEPMEAIVLAGKDRAPDSLTASDVEAIRTQAAEAREIWGQVTEARFDAALFGFAPEKHALMQRQIAAESAALDALQAALDAQDPAAIVTRAVALKPSFAALFMMFGDFDRTM